MKRRDIWLLAGVLAAAAVVFLVSRALPGAGGGKAGGMLTLPDLPGSASAGPAANATLAPAQAYLLVQVDDTVYAPEALLAERDIELSQPDGKLNVVHVTPDSIRMSSANCKNQDCVHQGAVTLDNRGLRILGNQIICLPNKVLLSLLTPEEAQREQSRLRAQ